MKKVIQTLALVFTVSAVLFIFLYQRYYLDFLLTLAITLGMTAYHFDMRLLVGYIVDRIMQNEVDYHKKWFQPLSFESKVYEILKVKKWKDKMPTYSPETFSLAEHSLEEIVQAMCQSEIVHEVIAICSLFPICLISIFGQRLVFILTSLIASCIDMMFVIMQRYNRPRIVRMIKRKSK